MTQNNISLHNRFDLMLVEESTGKIKQTAQAENVALNRFHTNLMWLKNFVHFIAIGTGTGTPAPTDTALFSQKHTMSITNVSSDKTGPVYKRVVSCTLPADSNYVGDYTEIGIFAFPDSSNLMTHAMLVDSESNPITIHKTELDILIITATVYLTIECKDENFHLMEDNIFKKRFFDNNTYNEYIGRLISTSDLCKYASDKLCTKSHRIPGGNANPWNYPNYAMNYSRIGTADANIGFINGLYINELGHMRLPNATFFPNYTLKGIPVGTGDGSKQDFDCPINYFVKDTDVLYKNGVALTRGVDYTIDNLQNKGADRSVSAFGFADYVNKTTRSSNSDVIALFGVALEATSEGNEVIVHLESPDPSIGTKINTIIVSRLNLGGIGSYSYNGYKGDIIVAISNDGEAWTEVYRNTYDGVAHNAISFNVTFTTQDVRYIKLSAPGVNKETGAKVSALSTHAGSSIAYYAGEPIHFTEAPAAGDVITLDVDLDRPYKNSNFVLDVGFSLQFN